MVYKIMLRYVEILVHLGAGTAALLKDMVVSPLSDFGIEVERNIIAATTDGASVMLKLGRILGCEHIQ